MMTDKEFDLDKFHLKIVYAGEFPDPHYTNDLIEAAEEALATIETLRRRVAELEDRQKTLVEAYVYDPRQWDDKESGGTATVLACLLLEKVREFIKNYGHDPAGNIEDAFAAITAENAELKRQVEALREDAEVGRLLLKILDRGKAFVPSSGNYWIHDNPGIDLFDAGDSYCGKNWVDALRKAAKGEVEG